MTKENPYWFFEKWGVEPSESLSSRIQDLEEKYASLLMDVKRLEEENIETTNTLYEIMNSVEGLDARIDILTLNNWIDKDVRGS